MQLVVRIYRDARGEDWLSGFYWLGWGALGGLLPLWGTAVLLGVFGRSVPLHDYWKNGEFILYGASFFAGSLFVLRRDMFPSRKPLTFILVVALLVCAIVFAGVSITNLPLSANTPNFLSADKAALEFWSWAMLGLSIGSGFLVAVADAAGLGLDIPETRRKDVETLSRQVDGL